MMHYNVNPDSIAKAGSLIWENCQQCNEKIIHLAAKVQQYHHNVHSHKTSHQMISDVFQR
jgi:hypothetical protein